MKAFFQAVVGLYISTLKIHNLEIKIMWMHETFSKTLLILVQSPVSSVQSIRSTFSDFLSVLRALLWYVLYMCTSGIFCVFCVFSFPKGYCKSLSESGMSCSESMSVVFLYTVSGKGFLCNSYSHLSCTVSILEIPRKSWDACPLGLRQYLLDMTGGTIAYVIKWMRKSVHLQTWAKLLKSKSLSLWTLLYKNDLIISSSSLAYVIFKL